MLRLADACSTCALLVALCTPAFAEAPDPLTLARAEQLRHYADQLSSSDAPLRHSGGQALEHVGRDFLPALLIRLQGAVQNRPAREDVARVLAAFRQAASPTTADDETDLATGVEAVLTRERTHAVRAVAEPLLYLRALEAMDDDRAELAIASFVGLDDGAWENELVMLRKRRGVRLLPTLITLRSHDDANVRRFALRQIEALGMTEPSTALALSDPYLLARLIHAYASPPDYGAMPLITRLVAAPRASVREAARLGVARYGKNAIWQLRELYNEHAGQPADRGWDAERTARELYRLLDRARLEDADALLDRGQKQLLANDLVAMRASYDLLLTKYPKFAERDKLAPGYATLAADRFAHDDLSGALAAYRRALWLDPSAREARVWKAEAAYVSAELTLTHGVADLDDYDRALGLDPSLRAAQQAREELTGQGGRRVRELKRTAAGASLALFVVLAALFLRAARRDKRRTLPPPTAA